MKVVIIGGVAGGASAAARLRRMDENAEIVLIEKSAYISYANCGLPYYIGGVIHDRQKLFVQTPSSFRQRFQIDARISSEVIRIDRDRKSVLIKNLNSEETYEEHYDKLILSPGAEPIRPPLPGLQLPGVFTLRNVADTDAIKKFTEGKSNAKAVVIGAGFIGLEMAENLHHLGMHVSVVEMVTDLSTCRFCDRSNRPATFKTQRSGPLSQYLYDRNPPRGFPFICRFEGKRIPRS